MSSTPTTVTRRQLRDRESDDMKKQNTPSPTVGVIQEKISENATPVSGSKIRTRLSTGTLFMNGTTTIKEKVIKSPALTPESAKIEKEMPGSKRKSSTMAVSEPTVIIPPKRRKIGNNDGSGENNKNDYFCWICHKDGGGVLCQICPRIYHLKCLGVQQVPKDWVCSECEKIMRAECTDTRSRAMTLISLDTLCLLLRYALDRMQQPGSDVFLKPVQPGTAPNYSDYVFNPVDFSTLEKNIKKKQYGCTEAFLADAKWILHNCILYNGLHHRLTNVARNIIKSCKHEMSELETCPECYQNSCLKGNASWFVEPCHPPHTLVWAKLKGYPFWPAKVLRELNGQVDVRFFGAHDRSWVLTSHVFLLSKDSPMPIKNRKGGFAAAMNELQTHLNLIRERFGTFDYAPDRTPYDQRHEVMKIKGLNLAGNRRFKSGSVSKLATRNKGLLKPEIERVSVASKTASAVKTKYNTMTTKKSGTIISQGRPLIIRQSGKDKDIYNIITPKPMSVSLAVGEEKSLKSNADPVVPTSKSLVVVSLSKSTKTSITDVIQHGIKAQTTSEEKEDNMMSEIKKGNDKSSVSDKMPTSHKVTVKNRNVTEVKKDIAMFESQKDKPPALLTVPESPKSISTPVIQQDIKKGKIAEEKEDLMSLENKKRKDKSCVLIAAKTATAFTVEISLQNVKEKNSAQEKEVIATLESSKGKDNSSVSDAGSQLVAKASADIIQQKAKESITEEENEACAILESSTKKDNYGLLAALSKPVTVSTACTDAILQKAKESTRTEENKGCAALESSKLKDNFIILDAVPQSPKGAAACAISQQKSEEKGAIGEKDTIFESSKIDNSGVLEVAPLAKTVIVSEVSKQNVKEHITTEERDCVTVLENKKIADNDNQEGKGKGASENVDAHPLLGFADVKVGALVDDSLCAQVKPVIRQDSALDVSLAAKEIQLQSESLKPVSSVANSKDMQTHLKDSVTLTCAKLEINSTPHKMQVLDQESSSTPDLPIFFPIFSSNLQNSAPKSNTEIALFKKDSDYKEALLKTIETCKGKLGITNIEDIEEAMNISAEEDGDKEEEIQIDSEDSSDKNCKSEEETSVSKDVSNSEKESIISPFRTETLSVSSQDSSVVHISSIEKEDFTFIKPFPDVLKKGDETVAYVSQTLHADTTTEKFNVIQGKDSDCSNATSKTKIDSETGKRVEPVTASKVVVSAVPAAEKKIVQTKLKTEKPIIIEDKDDDEPGLLMEVESEAEHDQLIIDLEDDNLDLQDTGSGLKSDKVASSQTCKKSSADGFLKELSPSPSVVKKIKQVQDNILRSKLSEPVSTSTSVVSLSTASILSVSSKTMPTISSEVNQPHLKSTEELTACGSHIKRKRSTSTSEATQRQSPKQKTTTSSSTNVSNIVIPVSSEVGSSQDESTLTPAAVKLINKYSTQLMCNMQQNLADMCKELLTSVQPEQEKSRFYQQETDRLKWIHQQEIAEIKHNYKLTIADMKACWEAEMAKNLNDLRRKLCKEKDEAVIGTKKKQWCASCLKEAIYYCCWNTSYCSYDCQQAHWPTHLPSCAQSQVSIPVTTTTQNKVISSGSITTSVVQGRPESDLVVMSASLGQATAKGGDKNERSQEDPWRKNRTQMTQQSIGQTVQYLPSGQQQHQQTSSQPLQQLQYLQSLGSSSQRAPFIQTSQVQLLGQRPSLTNFLPHGAVMSGNTMVLPILRTSQPGSSPTSQNISRQMQYQSMWK